MREVYHYKDKNNNFVEIERDLLINKGFLITYVNTHKFSCDGFETTILTEKGSSDAIKYFDSFNLAYEHATLLFGELTERKDDLL